MKKHLLTRILSITLAFTILSSDIFVYAASDTQQDTTIMQEEISDTVTDIESSDNQMEEVSVPEANSEDIVQDESAMEQTPSVDESVVENPVVDEIIVEEPIEEIAEEQPRETIEVQLDDAYYFVPETETSAMAMELYGRTEEKSYLKDSNEIKWIDRLDFTGVEEIKGLYGVLAEASDNDGQNDFLIDDVYLSSDYKLTTAEITKTVDVVLSDASDAEKVKEDVQVAVAECADEVNQMYSPYLIAVRDAFDRDHPEVFWLSEESVFGYGVTCTYLTPEAAAETLQAEYTITISMVLKGTIDGELYDVRAVDYRNQVSIEDGILLINSVCEDILKEAKEFSDYEKVKYFNEILTTSNEYNTSDDLNGLAHDVRECISALDGRTGTSGPVCEGYARALKVLCDKAEIPCVLVSGTAYSGLDEAGEAHMWNYVQLDDHWYGVDVTWNDPVDEGNASGAVSGYENEDWLFLGADTVVDGMTFEASHPVENLVSMGGVAFINGPQLSNEKYVDTEEEENGKEENEKEESENIPAIQRGYFSFEGNKYYADSNGRLQSGWIKIGSDWHFFDKESGCKELTFETSDGYLYKLENGDICYFTNKTTLLKNSWLTYTGAKYFFDENGFAVKGWHQDGTYWYYADKNGQMVNKQTIIDGENFFFDSSYHLSTGWKKVDGVFKYFNVDADHEKCYELTMDGTTGWVNLEDERRTYIDASTGALKGWKTLNGYRYHFDSDGFLDTGLFQDGRYHYYGETQETATPESPVGNVVKGIKNIDGKIYGFHTGSYYRLTGWQTINGERYYFQDDCSALIGWYEEGNYRYYAKEDGKMAKGVTKIGNETYCFDNNYRLMTGWYTSNGQKYYFNTDGKLRTGWFQDGANWYYADEDGKMAKGLTVIDGKTYLFHASSYYRMSGWQTVNSQKYYFGEEGFAVVGWYQEGDYWYHADENGQMAKGLVIIEGKQYYFDNNYRLSTGWKQINGEMYFFDSVAEAPEKCHALQYEGTIGGWVTLEGGRKSYINARKQVLTGWQTIEGKRYYFDADGIMETGLFQLNRNYYYAQETAEGDIPEGCIAAGAKVIDGKIYGFHTSQYYRLTGWQTLNGQRYYFKDDCSAVVGWYQEGNYWYYADEEGRMAKGVKEIKISSENEESPQTWTYYFDNNYRLTTGWIKIDNVWRFFDNAEDHLKCHEVTYTNNNGWLTLNEEAGRKSYVNSSNALLKGWQTIAGQRYYFDIVGIMETGEFKVGNSYYYAEPTDVVKDGAIVIPQGAVAKGIKVIDGETYVFHASGYQRLTGWQTVNGKRFFLNADGKAETGFFETGGRKYYAEPAADEHTGVIRGTVVTGRKEIDGKIYYFHTSQYYMLTGWQTISGQRYYLKEDGSAAIDLWYQEGDYWYHADENGQMAKGLVTIEGKQYYFDNNYRLSTGWKQIDGEMYFFDSVAEAPEKCHALQYEGTIGGWVTLEGGRKSYINARKQVLTGWQTIERKRYYFDADGIMETGLFQLNRNYYYAQETAEGDVPEGCIAAGAKVIDGKIYGFHTSQYYRLTGWQTLNGQRYYFKDDCSAVVGWYQEGNYWYYADEEGRMAKGLVSIGSKQYYFDNNYRLTTGWIKIDNVWRFFDNAEDHLKCQEVTYTNNNGWLTLNEEAGRKSYVNSSNALLKGWQTIAGQRYYFDTVGIMETGEFKVGNNYYYAEPTDVVEDGVIVIPQGAVAKGTKVIDGETYVFHASGYQRLTGWQTVNGKRFFLNADGKAETGFFETGGRKYYAEPVADEGTGVIQGTVVTGRKEITGSTYIFHTSQYYMLTGWQTISGQRYYLKEDGSAVVDSWYQEGDYWYHADEKGQMAKGLVTIKGKQYYFDNNYRLSTGWKQIDGEMYFFDSVAEIPEKCHALQYEGTIGGWVTLEGGRKSYINARKQVLTGWQTIEGKRYYFDADGIMETGLFQLNRNYYYAQETAEGDVPEGCIATGAKVIDGKIYGFHTSQYYRLTGWQTLNGQRYYFKDDCSAVVGWYQEGTYWYYADEEGRMAKGLVSIGSKQYYFDNNYRLTTGWIKIDNVWRFFDNAEDHLKCHEVTYTNNNGWLTLNEEAGRKSYVNSSNALLKGWQTIAGQRYYFDTLGIMETSEFKVGNSCYYAEPTDVVEGGAIVIPQGAVAKGMKVIDGKIYVFHASSYYRLSGWQTVNGQRYYLKKDGSAVVDEWYQDGDYWYHADENGQMTNGLVTIEGKQYYFDNNYRLKTGWQTIGGVKYHFAGAELPQDCYRIYSGPVTKGWFVFEGNISYFNNSLNSLTGWQTIESKRYYFDANGVVTTGWFKVGNDWYYANEQGQILKDFVIIGDKQYYFDSSYRLKTGWQTIGGKKYFFENGEKPEECYMTNEGMEITSGWMTLENGQICYADNRGNIKTGWQTIDKERYYFDANGVLQTGWFQVGSSWYYGEPEAAEGHEQEIPVGVVAKGIREIAGKTYVFHTSSYYRLTGWQTISGQRFYLDTDGVAKTGWFTISGKTYYAEETTHDGIYAGTVAKGGKEIDGQTYFFHSSQYYMQTGFQSYNGNRYYLQADGTARTGWFTVGTDLYYGEPVTTESGVIKGTLAKGAKEIAGETYFFHTSSNYRMTGWQTVNGQRYYLDADGTARTGWFIVSGKIYYGEPVTTEAGVLKGTLAKGAKEIGGKTYVFHTGQYYRMTGWQTVDGQRYYLNTDGVAKTGWFTVSGKTYYADPAVAKGLKEIAGETYYFHTSQYYMLTGWQTVNRERYYFKADGAAETGWFKEGAYYYYAKPEGKVVKDLAELPYKDSGETRMYYFDGNYRLKTGWITSNGKKYFFESKESPEECYMTNVGMAVTSGWMTLENGQICYADNRGNIKTGWQTIDKERYYFDANGVLQTGWFTISGKIYYAEETTHDGIHAGTVAKGGKEIDGQTYFFHSSQYYMQTGFQSYNGNCYYLQADGTARTGWFTVGTDLYYGEPVTTESGVIKGTLAKGAKEIAGETYFFHTSSNYRMTGWQTVNGQRYYLDADGTARTGWFIVSGKIYYGEPVTTEAGVLKGTLAKGAKEIGGKTYVFHTSQHYRMTGWQTVDGQRYYLNTNGVAKTGWFTVSGKTYYADPAVAKGLKEIAAETYYFHTSQYYMLTGWQTVNRERYYFKADGAAETGWFKEGAYYYYAKPEGKVVKDLAELPYKDSGETRIYYFDGNYRLKTGWITSNGKKYFFESKESPEECYMTNEGLAITSGWMTLENGQICYADNRGNIKTGWQTIDKERYYFDANGVLQTGWFTISGKTYYAEETTHDGIYAGTVAKGGKEIDGQTYFFHSSQYYMMTGFQSYNGNRYYLQADGTARTGWFTVGTDLYYGEPVSTDAAVIKGTLAKGAKEIDGETYFFHTSSNYRMTGWQMVNGQKYYLDADGTARTGWFTAGGKIYYGEPVTTEDGVLKGTLAKGVKEIGGKTYVFHTGQYYRLTGWQTVDGQRYYLNTDGVAKTGWFTVSGKTYYADPAVAKGLKEIDGETYYFHTSQYYMLTGWQTVNRERYYFKADGAAETGWFKEGTYHYYAKPEGKVVKDLAELPYKDSGETRIYYFDSNYRQKTGWITISGKKYFFENKENPEECYMTNEGMAITSGWMTLENGQICYADNRGNIKTGWQTIDKERYYFDANGVLQTGWFKVGNSHYYGEPKAAEGCGQEIPVGAAAKGLREIDGEIYIFHTSQYQMLTGFQSYNGNRYYLQKDGTARTGWFTVSTDLYYGEPATTEDGIWKGTLAKGAKEISGATYFFHTTSNYRLSGWQSANGQKYYLNANGKAKTGWFTINGQTYYGEPETSEDGLLKGRLAKDVTEIDGRTYVFHNTNYNRLTGWQTVGVRRYYLQANGSAKTGWFKLNGHWYYGAENSTEYIPKGTMEKAMRKVVVSNGEETTERTYYFDTEYRLSTGWKVVNGIRYFFNVDENPENCYLIYSDVSASGWFVFDDGRKSYFDTKGNLKTGWQTIEGKKYYFDASGIMQTGWYMINGTEYFFNTEGVYIPMTAPVITSVTSTFYKTADVQWNVVEGVEKYILEYSTNPVFPSWETTRVEIADAAIGEYRAEELLEDTTYYFRLCYTTWSEMEETSEMYQTPYSVVKNVKIRGESEPTSTSASMLECQIVSGSRDGGMDVEVTAELEERVKSADDKYYVVMTESYGTEIDSQIPVGVVEKAFEIDMVVTITGEDVDRALMNKFALAILKQDGTYQVISEPMGITNPEFISENTVPILVPESKKGLQGINRDNALYTNSKNTLFNLDLAEVVGTGPADGFVEYEYKGNIYYFSDCSNFVGAFKNLAEGYEQYIQEDRPTRNKVAITLNLLLSYKSRNNYLIDPAARTRGHKYYTLNVREEKARETLEAVFLYLGELFGQSDCYVTHWVLGNEVNSSRAWNYQGNLSFDAYMQSYTTAFRLLYNGVKAAKTGNNVYISLDNGWTAAPDTYAGKTTLDKFAAYAQEENPDMLWSVAYHGYSYPLTKCDFWNDNTNTTNSISTRYISMKNIYVLTDYVETLEEKYNKPEGSMRVILSEQGYNAGQGHYVQAQALARGYYMAEFNDRIDAFIIRAIIDDWEETAGGLYLGLQNVYQEKRTAFYTYEYMDTSLEYFSEKPTDRIASSKNWYKVDDAKEILCGTDWESIIPNFSRSKLANMY